MNIVLNGSLKHSRILIPYYNATKVAIFDGNAYGLRERVRKPWWLPKAKTKIYFVPPPCIIPDEDTNELHRLYCAYRTKCRTINTHLNNLLQIQKQSLEDKTSQLSLVEEQDEFMKAVEENRIWNEEVAKIRELRLQEKDQLRAEKIEEIKKRRDKTHNEMVKKAEEQIQKWKEISPTFITRDKVDEAIEKALKSTVDYNYAIDLDGNIYPGREGGFEDEKQAARA